MTKPVADADRRKPKPLFAIGEPPSLERLKSATIESPDGCWTWQRSGRGLGARYGVVTVLGRCWATHRLAWTLVNGPIPGDLTVDHMCFNTRCINPAHLRLLTAAENSSLTPRRFRTHCVQGHEFTPENTKYVDRGGVLPCRICRTCRREVVRRNNAKRRAAA